ncbi:MAG TPA: hypothetical protein VGR26_10680 [Acidimicrobiales bacterium]|nr:hypothetical protein [Acidimicrobiales bacterium]
MAVDNEVELISDGEGLAVIGNPTAVERFMASVGLSSNPRSPRLGAAFSAGASVAQTGSEIAANSGRWVKLTQESARTVKTFGWMDTKTPGVSYAMVGQPGDIKQWIKIVKSPGSMVSNPAMLAGAAGIMAQFAMQQQMGDITDYLAAIDQKLDAVLRSQTNQVLARLDGVDLAVREAMSVREAVGRVSEVTWSKVQNSAQAIHETQGYALRQLGDLADKMEEKNKIGDLVETAKEAEAETQKWLVVLARCFELHDAVAVIELDRVLDASPDELDRHRLGLKSARRHRLELLSERTERLLGRMNAAVGMANSKVLFNPKQSPAVVKSSNHVAAGVYEFHELLGIESGRVSSEARRWREAAAERWGSARATGASSVDTVKNFGGETRDQARSVKGKLSDRIAERKLRRSEDDQQHDEQS